MSADPQAERNEIAPQLAAANINSESFLATDYLNHYNEIAMLLEMAPDMPDIIEDCEDWSPKSYEQHFMDSGFQAKELAVKAFTVAPENIKKAFYLVTGILDDHLLQTLAGLRHVGAAERGLTPAASALIKHRVQQTHDLLAKLNQIIHGQITDSLYDDVTSIGARAPAEDRNETQSAIDELFD